MDSLHYRLSLLKAAYLIASKKPFSSRFQYLRMKHEKEQELFA
jgi:hypothetical protein